VLHTSRTNPARMRKLPAHLVAQDFPASLSAKGGEDLGCLQAGAGESFGARHRTSDRDRRRRHARLCGQAQRTRRQDHCHSENDGQYVRNTEYCIGFSTAITRASDAIQRQRTTVGSHERISVFRVFGRDAGFTALYTAYATSIRCVIPEYRVNLDRLIQLLLEDKRLR
jgi:ATP-dependent phosphofructokinase / diphosphate-dependent phosphofructokinase